MSNYISITLLNIDYKILTRVLMKRVKPVIENFVKNRQTDFLSGRQMKDNIMSANLVMHLIRVEKRNGYAIFLDM